MKKNKPIPKTYIRFFNALPSTHVFDYYIDDKLIASRIEYEDFTKYIKIPSGQHEVYLTPYKEKEKIFSKKINLRPHSIFTLITSTPYRGGEIVNLFSLEEPSKKISSENCFIRTCSFIYDLPLSDFSLTEEQTIFRNLHYSVMTSYFPFELGSHSIRVTQHDNQEPILAITPLLLKPCRFYTAYLIGNGTKCYPHKTIVSVDGRSFLPIEKAQVKA